MRRGPETSKQVPILLRLGCQIASLKKKRFGWLQGRVTDHQMGEKTSLVTSLRILIARRVRRPSRGAAQPARSLVDVDVERDECVRRRFRPHPFDGASSSRPHLFAMRSVPLGFVLIRSGTLSHSFYFSLFP